MCCTPGARCSAGGTAGNMNSGCLVAVGSDAGGVRVAQPAASTSSAPTMAARTLFCFNRILLLRRGGQTLDEPPRHVGLDHHAAVRRDVTDDARHAIEPRDLLAVEFLVRIEGDGVAARVERKARRDHLQ